LLPIHLLLKLFFVVRFIFVILSASEESRFPGM